MRSRSLALLCWLLAACGTESDSTSQPPPDLIARDGANTLEAAATSDQIVYRVNVGGPALSGSPSWSADTAGSPSPYGNASATGNQVYSVSTAINTSDPSVPAGTPSTLFQTERWDPAGGSEMQWNFPVISGSTYEVRLYFAEIYSGTQYTGARKFDVSIEGALVYNDLDVYAAVGGYKGLVKSYTVTMSNTNLDIDFIHGVENPALKGIEILKKADGTQPPPPSTGVSFGKSLLGGESSSAPTSLQFGPDGRLYVADMNGVIRVYSVKRNGANSYSVTGTQTITSIQAIPNHNDNGALNSVTGRLVTGLIVTGTAANPVIYVTSSDPRIGGGATGDLNVDTNSGILSRLTWTGTSWAKKDLVRGLPRSEENHASNGMALENAMLYLAQGGHTNMGAPAKNFVYLPEYALSGAILKIDLAAIGETTYDLPTLDDETRSGTPDAGDPFGGNNGKNQAKLVPGGPVQIHAPGFRNIYDLVISAAGKLYTVDNGSNAGWGDVPIGEGAAGTCTNGVNEPGVTFGDGLHYVSAAGYYGGHPNPTRANTNNKFNGTNPQSPVPFGNPVECDFRTPAAAGALVEFPSSTNGLAEYTASNFGGAMQGNLLAAGYVYNTLYRVVLNSTGTGVSSNQALFSSVGTNPLDVVAVGDTGAFPGTIWVADQGSGQIVVFEPGDYGSSTPPTCTGADYAMLDEDADGYDNADEIDNHTNPCSAADVPPDADKDLTSNLNDPDDDNDGWADTADPFAVDAQNGKGRTPNFLFEWAGDTSTGILGLGFTGLMTNGASNYESLFNIANLTAGGAAGVLTIDAVPAGDAYQTMNTQQYGFQLGVNANPAATGPFTVHTRIMAPFQGLTPADFQSMGLFVGTGDQDNYVKLVVSANGGQGGVELLKEVGSVTSNAVMAAQALPGPEHVDLYLRIDPAAASITASYTATVNGVTSAPKAVGAPVSVPSTWFTATSRGLALGVIATSLGSGKSFPATWAFLEAAPEQAGGSATLAHDDFGRSVSGGWGTAEVGGAWSVLAGGTANFAVSSGIGRIYLPAGATERVAALGVTARDVDIAANLALTATPAAGDLYSYLLVRRQSGGAYYRIGLRVTPTGKIYLRGQDAAGNYVFGDTDTGLVFTPGAYYRLRVLAQGASPTRLRAHAWKAGTAEPSSWIVDISNSASGLQQAGGVGVRTINLSTKGVYAKFDALHAVTADGSTAAQ